MPEGRLARTRQAYESIAATDTIKIGADYELYIYAKRADLYDTFDYVTDPQTGLTTMVRRPQEFKVRVY